MIYKYNDELPPDIVEKYNAAISDFIKTYPSRVQVSMQENDNVVISLLYGYERGNISSILREIAARCRGSLIDDVFRMDIPSCRIVYVNTSILRFAGNLNAILEDIPTLSDKLEAYKKPIVSKLPSEVNLPQTFNTDVETIVNVGETFKTQNISASKQESMGITTQIIGNKEHMIINPKTVEKYANSHVNDELGTSLNNVVQTIVETFTNSPSITTTKITEKLESAGLILERLNKDIIMIGKVIEKPEDKEKSETGADEYEIVPGKLQYIVLHYGNPTYENVLIPYSTLTSIFNDRDQVNNIANKIAKYFDLKCIEYEYPNPNYIDVSNIATTGPKKITNDLICIINKCDNTVVATVGYEFGNTNYIDLIDGHNTLVREYYTNCILANNDPNYVDPNNMTKNHLLILLTSYINFASNVRMITDKIRTDKTLIIPYKMQNIDHTHSDSESSSIAVQARIAIKQLIRLGESAKYADFFNYIKNIALKNNYISQEDMNNSDNLTNKLEQFIDERYFRIDDTDNDMHRPSNLILGTSDGFASTTAPVATFADDVINNNIGNKQYSEGGTNGIYLIPYDSEQNTKTQISKDYTDLASEEITTGTSEKELAPNSNMRFHSFNLQQGESVYYNLGCCIVDAAIQTGRPIDIYLME